VLGPY